MSVVLFVLMSYQHTGQKNHEIFGAIMLVLFILHHILNYKWFKNLGKGKYSPQRLLLTVTDCLMLVVMLLLMISGIGMSRYVFRFLNFDMSMSLARNMHMVASYLSFLIMGFHIGQHFGMILGRLRKFNIKPWILQIIAAITAIYGLVALVKRNFLSYITLRMHFVNFNYEEPIIYYELDLFSILI